MSAGRTDERGMALAMALFALLVLGALVSGAFVVSHYNQAAAANTSSGGRAESAADAGLAAMYATWDPLVQGTMPVWDGTPATIWTSGIRSVAGSAQLTYVDSVRRLNPVLFLVQSTGRQMSPGGAVLAELTSAQLFRLVKPTIGANAAVTVQDPLVLNGNGFTITGMNSLPPEWSAAECDPVDPGSTDDVVGVRSSGATGVTGPAGNVVGFPAPDAPNDPTVTSATFRNFLDYTYSTLAGQPGAKVLSSSAPYSGIAPAVDASGACDRTAPGNFGEPTRSPPNAGAIAPCYDYFPVVHGTAAVTRFSSDSRGQGTLLIDGDLDIAGGFRWVGLIIVKGRVTLTGNAEISGAVLAEGSSVTTGGAVSGNVTIAFSRCAIERAVGGATMARPLGQRSWLQVY